MHIEHIALNHSCDLSLAPLDCGFDPRVRGMICRIPADAQRVGYERDGEPRIVTGSIGATTAELEAAGYRVQVG